MFDMCCPDIQTGRQFHGNSMYLFSYIDRTPNNRKILDCAIAEQTKSTQSFS